MATVSATVDFTVLYGTRRQVGGYVETERDELANLIASVTIDTKSGDVLRVHPDGETPVFEGDQRTADALLAAGYRKLQQISTEEELDELPVGSVVAMIGSEPDAPAVACRAVLGWQFLGGDPERRYSSSSITPSPEPLTVLHVGSTP